MPSAVRTVGGHGFQNVGYRQNFCFGKNLVAGECPRIAAAVHAFVMLTHDLGNLQIIKLQVFENFVTRLRMAFDDFEYLRCWREISS